MTTHTDTQDRSGGDTPADSLELLGEQDRVMVQIFDGWDATTPSPDVDDAATIVRSGFERGTYGKLLIEHAALRVAAKSDVARVLRDMGQDGLADDLTRHLPEFSRLLDCLDGLARGVEPMGVAASDAFAGRVGELAALIRADLEVERARLLPHIADVLAEHRGGLHTARWVNHHAPTHPSSGERWYAHIPALVRIQARYDRLRGFPWADSPIMADTNIADAVEDDT